MDNIIDESRGYRARRAATSGGHVSTGPRGLVYDTGRVLALPRRPHAS